MTDFVHFHDQQNENTCFITSYYSVVVSGHQDRFRIFSGPTKTKSSDICTSYYFTRKSQTDKNEIVRAVDQSERSSVCMQNFCLCSYRYMACAGTCTLVSISRTHPRTRSSHTCPHTRAEGPLQYARTHIRTYRLVQD